MGEETFRILHQGDPSDTRFQFEIIKGLSDSIRQLATQMADMQRTQVSMLERLATLEAGKVSARIDEVEDKLEALMSDKYRRDGAIGALGAIKAWAPFLAMLFSAACALWLYGRSVGIVPAPPAAAAKVEATIQHDERRIEGVVGGKP